MADTYSVDSTGVEHLIGGRGDKLPFEETEYKVCDNQNINSHNKSMGTSMCSKCQAIIDRR